MTPETVKELETLIDEWANEPSGVFDDTDFATVMDALPDLLAAVKERDALRDKLTRCIGMVQRWQPAGSPPPTDEVGTIAWIMQSLSDERDAALKERDELKDNLHAMTASQQICVGAAGIGDFSELCGWIDKVKADRDAANAKCAEMKDRIRARFSVLWQRLKAQSSRQPWTLDLQNLERDVLTIISTNLGDGYHHERDCEPLVEALRDTLNILLPNLDIIGIKLPHERHVIERAQQALAHFEGLKR